ncbi:winged helix-turn-helix transcriptional regulator [Fodinicola feengrottensis]|uniref:Helix-turn-helix domain-containing protein n=1 Tax=Fodinicola feengrottensis TaxID=435914 RepID=A0ABP4U089_9ACTN|nr:helix-turn-helix domain-containing protein [Fodinicola feengrottensis]
MRRTSFANWPCQIAQTVDLLGDWWTPLVLREAFYGIKRFDEFQSALGIARNTLTERLNRLVTEGLLEKVPYHQEPVRYEYVLTGKGKDFFPVLAAIAAWGDRWLYEESSAPITMHHTTCDHDAHAEVVCSHCHTPLASDEVRFAMGPGYPPKLATRPDVVARFARQAAG